MQYVFYHRDPPGNAPAELGTDPTWGVAVRADQPATAGHGEGMWHVVWTDGREGFYHESFLKFAGDVPGPDL